ncbi:MAG TPA: hypothetical protein VHB73_02855, partial [Alphaproteobacteria bacterium]|nr:hypothetical protein [Alphaproteobacteria bacterium]
MANWGRYYGGVFNDAAEQARAAYFHSLTEPVALEWIYGLHFILQPGENISRAVCISGYYEPNSLLALQDYLKPGDVF